MNSDYIKIIKYFILFKSIQFLIVYSSPSEQFDNSSTVLIDKFNDDKFLLLNSLPISNNFKNFIDNHIIRKILNKFIVWDSVYFIKTAKLGRVEFEHEWVFGQLWCRLLNKASCLITNSNTDSANFYVIIIVGLIFNNLMHLLSCFLIHFLTIKNFLLDDSKKKLKNNLPLICSLLTIVQPSGIFTTGIYSESITQFLCFTGLALRELAITEDYSHGNRNNKGDNFNIDKKFLYLASGLIFSISFGMRSNSILYGLIYINDLLRINIKKLNFKKILNAIVILTSGSILFFSLIYSIYKPYVLYCPERGDWCGENDKFIDLNDLNFFKKWLISYSQVHYWDVGFLAYFTNNNIPNFLIALPSSIILLLSCLCYCNNNKLSGIVILSSTYLFLQFTSWHVQIINRVMSFTPIYIWFVGELINNENVYNKKLKEDSKNNNKNNLTGNKLDNSNKSNHEIIEELVTENQIKYTVKINKFGKYIARWWVIWVLCQTGLYACFLPPA
ncbi:hypothetical protein BVG19_g4465 [[Candida] boidinii]|nr:hypothetical protein BVG19_g4465 [[Candida] boidinii]OWB49354.1 hypothetical protein B5S27_g894 [[Candida] boidinii]